MSRDRKISVRSVMGGILCVIFIPVIFINLTLIISTYTKPGEMPGVFGIKPAIVLSGSMEPVIQTGDMIFLHSTDPARLQTGDVIHKIPKLTNNPKTIFRCLIVLNCKTIQKSSKATGINNKD